MMARYLALWTTAVVAVAIAMLAHLTLRFETVRLGYEVGKARQEQRRLVESKRRLAVEVASLKRAPRIEAIARGTLAMDMPDPARIVSATQRGATAEAGRAR